MNSPVPPSQSNSEYWVPVDRRFLGVDRRTILPALVVVGLLVAMTYVLPGVYRAIPYDDEVKPGDVMGVKDGVTFVPTPGWGITAGRRVSDENRSGEFSRSVTVESGDVALTVTTGSFSGNAGELLDQLEDLDEKLNDDLGLHVTGPTYAIATNSGINGVARRYRGTKTDGLLATFVVDGLGVRVVVTGPPDGDGLSETAEDFARMIGSISYEPPEEGSK